MFQLFLGNILRLAKGDITVAVIGPSEGVCRKTTSAGDNDAIRESPETWDRSKLANNIIGYYQSAPCGASGCGADILVWKQGDFYYKLKIRGGKLPRLGANVTE